MTPRRIGRMLALPLVAACALTVASAGGAAGQVLPELPPVPKVQLPSVPTAPALKPPSTLEVPETPPLPSVPSPRVELPAPSVRVPPSTPPGGSTIQPDSAADAAAPPASTRSGAGARPAERGADRRQTTRPSRRAPTRRERRFRRTVTQLWACAYAVSGFEHDVLARRAGLDGFSPAPASAVARQLGVSVGRIKAAQRSGVRSLRSADRSDGCAMTAPPTTVGKTATALLAVATAPPLVTDGRPTLADAERKPASQGDDRVEVLSAHRTSTGVSASRPQPAVTLAIAGDGGPGLPWLVIVVLAFMATTLFLLRRAREPGEALVAPPPVAPPPEPLPAEPPPDPVPVEPPPEPVPAEPSRHEFPPAPWTEPAQPSPIASPPESEPDPEPATRRTAGVAATGIASLAVTLLMRARRRR